MTPQPLYTAESLRPAAYKLRYSWSGWPSSGTLPESIPEQLWQQLDTHWEKDGLRKLAAKCDPTCWQLLFSTTPVVSPVLLAARIKGRLQHALRQCGTPVDFSRKVAVRSVGDNHTDEVQAYISSQVEKSDYVDVKFKTFLEQFRMTDATVDLSDPTATHSGRYWYNLHVVLVVRQRHAITSQEVLTTIRDRSVSIAQRKGYQIARLAVMPDHWHVALRGHVEQSPQEIALAFLNNLAYALGQNAVWEYGYYAGTFGEYDMNAVRRLADQSASPAGKPAGVEEGPGSGVG
jgi:REP element-mobilizing transposase RayT